MGNVLYIQWPESEPKYNYVQCLAISCGKYDLRSINDLIYIIHSSSHLCLISSRLSIKFSKTSQTLSQAINIYLLKFMTDLIHLKYITLQMQS